MARNEQPDPAEPKEEIKTSDFVIFPDLEGTPKTRTISLYGEVNEELCRLAILNLYYYRDTGKYEEEVDTEDEDAEPETNIPIINYPLYSEPSSLSVKIL